MSIRKLPKVGQLWQLKNDRSKQAKVLEVWSDCVLIAMPWTKRGESGKAMDTFMKQYQICVYHNLTQSGS